MSNQKEKSDDKKLGVLKSISGWFENWWDNMVKLGQFITGQSGIDLYPPGKLERKIKRNRRIIASIIITGIIALFFLVLPFIRKWYDLYYALWSDSDGIQSPERLSYIATFWGAIIGSIIAVLSTIISTTLIIRRERQVDRHAERIGHMPIIEIKCNKELTKGLVKSRDENSFFKKNGIDSYSFSRENILVFEIKNIGDGIALKLDTTPQYDSGAYSYPFYTTLSKQETRLFATAIEFQKLCFHVTFFDVFENQYEQSIEFNREGELTKFNIPELIKRTPRFRYVQ